MVVERTASSAPEASSATLASGKAIPLRDLKVGDVISVRAGEVVLADGEVVSGEGK